MIRIQVLVHDPLRAATKYYYDILLSYYDKFTLALFTVYEYQSFYINQLQFLIITLPCIFFSFQLTVLKEILQ